MKTIVIYNSKTGFTKKYAQWLKEELSADIVQAKDFNINNVLNYDTIIYGGGLYASSINGIKVIINNFNLLKDKKIIVYATGASPSNKNLIDEIKKKNFTSEQQEIIKFYYFRGGFNYKELSLPFKMMISLFKWGLKKKKDLSPDEKEILKTFDNNLDLTEKNNIKELIKDLKK